MRWRGWRWWRRYWLAKLLERLFPKAVRLIVHEEMCEALHPDFGWLWRDEEQGGKYLAQARAQGWRDCFDEILSGRGRRDER